MQDPHRYRGHQGERRMIWVYKLRDGRQQTSTEIAITYPHFSFYPSLPLGSAFDHPGANILICVFTFLLNIYQLLTPDVLSSLTALLSPVGGTKISDNIFSAILKSFTNIGRSSPEVATNLLDAGLADTVYGILIGQTPPEIPDEHDLALELTSNSSVITQALMRKDRNQIQQAIDLVVEVLPPLPKTGTFDPKLAKRPTTPHENVAMKDEEATYTSVTEAPAPSNEASNSFSAARSLMDEDVKPDISARTLAALAYSSSSQIKELNKEAATAH
ncbi:hypothetical protein Pst134EB_019955 [Puccinia striiformis f. sp. tritici]|nr:hypothetical protein Pst134EB_019955 [Puccinia striiformis f. sp. tritici]